MRPRNTASSTASSSITRSGLAALALVPLLAAALTVTAVPSASAAGNAGFRGFEGSVTPRQAVPRSVDPQRIVFRFRAGRALRIEIRIRRISSGRGRLVRRFVTAPLRPGRWHRRTWGGLDSKRRLVGAGRYRVRIGPLGGRLRTVARPRLHSHRFPVAGSHGNRGYIGTFGAPRTGGRIHEGFDVTAACGTPLVALRSGTVLKTAYDAALKGYYVVLKGRAERRTYLYAHLARPAPVRRGQTVRAGRRLGSVGQTGNAASTPCHLHIEVRSRGSLLDPAPLLSAWDW
jgi:murein DD-endopeptidase MepM/ murein hydrolase activator NlpD